MEIDHIFIFTKFKAEVGDLLVDFGVTEGSSNVHEGQGTANRRFFFKNFMLELLWVENSEEVQNERTKPMRLYERSKLQNDISPFGIAFRPTEENEEIKFSTWSYKPVYLPDFLNIQVAKDTPLSEPMYFYLSFASRQDKATTKKPEPMEHKIPLNEITKVKVYVNQDTKLSESTGIINQTQQIEIIRDNENLLEIEFDKGKKNQTKDFRPHLPLIFKW